MAESDVESLDLNMNSSDEQLVETRKLTSALPSGSLKAKKKRRKAQKQSRVLCGCFTALFILLVILVLLIIPLLAYNVYKLRVDRDFTKASHEAEILYMQKELDRAAKCPRSPLDGLVQFESESDLEVKSVLQFDRVAFRERIESERNMLESYYQDPASTAPANDTLIRMLGIKPGDEQYAEGVEFIAQKMARALVWGDAFNIGVIGSSVAAGHDNCAYDAYEGQLQRQLEPIWELANVKFTVRNAGQGGGCGDSFRNQIWCVRAMMGDDIDVGHYSWTYFEAGASTSVEHESFIRWLLMMPRSPAAVIFNTGGNENCLTEATHADLGERYGKFGFNAVCLSAGVAHHGYKGLHWGAIGDGMHNTTRYGEGEEEGRKNSLGVFFRNWHPGPLGFQVTSDAFAYYYLDIMLRALELISEVVSDDADAETIATKRDELVARWPKEPPLFDLKKLGSPLHCEAKFCAGTEPPGCANFELPTFGKGQVSVLKMNDAMNPFNEKYNASAKWTFWKAPDSDLIPREEKSLPECQFADHCAGWQAVGGFEAGWITFRLPRMDVGRVVVCIHGSKGEAFLAANTTFMLENEMLFPQHSDVIYGKCLVVQKEFPSSMTDAKGHLHLGVFVNSSSTITITHVITV